MRKLKTSRHFDIELDVSRFEVKSDLEGIDCSESDYDAFVVIGKGRIKLPMEVAAEFHDFVVNSLRDDEAFSEMDKHIELANKYREDIEKIDALSAKIENAELIIEILGKRIAVLKQGVSEITEMLEKETA